jgi:uncharacterized OB-fold protein
MIGRPQKLPLPQSNRATEPFWAACAQHRLVIQRCAGCGTYRHSPAPICAKCQSAEHSWEESRGTGEVYSYMVAHHPVHASLKEQVPYAVVVVKLDDCGGVCLTANLSDTQPTEVRVGMRVKVDWLDVGDGASLPQFRRA